MHYIRAFALLEYFCKHLNEKIHNNRNSKIETRHVTNLTQKETKRMRAQGITSFIYYGIKTFKLLFVLRIRTSYKSRCLLFVYLQGASE